MDGDARSWRLPGPVRWQPRQPPLRPHGRPLLLLRQRGGQGSMRVMIIVVREKHEMHYTHYISLQQG